MYNHFEEKAHILLAKPHLYNEITHEFFNEKKWIESQGWARASLCVKNDLSRVLSLCLFHIVFRQNEETAPAGVWRLSSTYV